MHRLIWLSVLSLSSCIFQGPWEYELSGLKPFHGVEANAPLIANRSISQICFERVLDLDEAHTPGFAWYQKAQIEITGPWSDGSNKALSLVANSMLPACFEAKLSDTALKPVAGGHYMLKALIDWDSAGTLVKSNLSAETRMPQKFAVVKNKGAFAPKIASPTPIQTPFYNYSHQDTALFMGGNIGNSSHVYQTDFDSATTGGVLVAQRIDTSNSVPANAFSQIAARFNGGFVPPKSLGFRGQIRQVNDYPNQSIRGNNILDSIAVQNTYFFGGLNRLYFYAHDSNYTNFVETYVNGQDDPKVIPQFNVKGGWGFFSGMIVDSFDVNIKIPETVVHYSYFETFAAKCAPGKSQGVFTPGWTGNECYEFEPFYCKTVAYDEKKYAAETQKIGQYPAKSPWEGYSDCQNQLALASLNQGKTWDALALELKLPLPSPTAQKWAQDEYCIAENFKSDFCKVRMDLLLKDQDIELLSHSQTYCLYRDFRDTAGVCQRVALPYLSNSSVKMPNLKKNNQNFCNQNPTDPFCKKWNPNL